MKLAVNYSLPSLALLRDGKIRMDLFKCPPWPERVAEARRVHPTYVHFSMKAGTGCADDKTLKEVEGLLSTSDTPHVNLHLSPHPSCFESMALETRDPADGERLIQAMLDDIRFFSSRFGKEKIVLENHPWTLNPKHLVIRPAIEATTITRVVRESGCRLLLDITHARISARYLGVDVREYMSSLPVDHLGELHVSGVGVLPGDVWEDHYALQGEDWVLVEWVIEQIREGRWSCPWAMVFEYGGIGAPFALRSDPNVLGTQVPRLFSLARSVEPQ